MNILKTVGPFSIKPLIITACVAVTACSDTTSGSGNNTGPAVSSNTAQFSSEKGGIVATDSGQKILVSPGAIPKDASGQSAEVTFSAESGSTPPAPLPGDVDLVGTVTKFGPDGFDFAWPLTTTLPIPDSATSLTGLQYRRYAPGSSGWTQFPGFAYVTDDSGKVTGVSAASYDLGYDALVMTKTSPKTASASEQEPIQERRAPIQGQVKLGVECDSCDGAMRWTTNSCGNEATNKLCTFYFAAKTYKPKYPYQQLAFQTELDRANRRSLVYDCTWNAAQEKFIANTSGICGMFVTGTQPTGEPARDTLFNIMQGDWEFCVTKSQWVIPGGSLPLPGKWTYNKTTSIKIDRASHNTCQVFDCWSNVKNIALADSGQWLEPADLPACPVNNSPTVPVGTGDFQATLTWVNNDTRDADLDLHLYGPNEMHVFYNNEISSDGKLRLDRDWQDEPGSAVENIFSNKGAKLSGGTYRLVVNHFDGSLPIDFSVRVVLNKVATTYHKTFTKPDEDIEIVQFNE